MRAGVTLHEDYSLALREEDLVTTLLSWLCISVGNGLEFLQNF